MKKIMISIALLVMSTLPALAQTLKNEGGPGSLAELLFAREKAVASALVKKDEKTFNNLVANDAVNVNPHGRQSRAELMADVLDPDYSFNTIALEDPQIRMLDKDTAIVTCRVTSTWTSGGKSVTAKGYMTNVWARRDGEWKVIFHTASVERQPAAPR